MPRTNNARTTLGLPFLPPAAMSEATTRLRNRIGRLHRRLAPPPVQILESVLSLLDHRVLVALCRAGLPETLTAATTVAELSSRLSVEEERLNRLVRFAATRGWLDIDRRGVVRPNKVTEFLRSDHPGGWRAWVDFLAVDAVVAAIAALDLETDGDPFVATAGTPFFAWMADHPDHWATFDRAMAAGGRMHALTLDKATSWQGVTSVCDVGGGTGNLVAALLDLHPNWRGAVLDLPPVVARAVQHDRMEAIAGDAFESVPPGFDAYLLVNVLHDWSDADAVRILKSVAAALDDSSRVIVVDNRQRARPVDELAIRADVLMAALTAGGKERSADAFAALGAAAGLRLVRTTPLASGDLAHEFRP